MSNDKRKKHDRAMAFIRSLRAGYRGFPKGEAKMTFSGPPSAMIRYCVNKGLASVRRSRWGEIYAGRGSWPRHNVLDADSATPEKPQAGGER